jgi:hypothetical protein
MRFTKILMCRSRPFHRVYSPCGFGQNALRRSANGQKQSIQGAYYLTVEGLHESARTIAMQQSGRNTAIESLTRNSSRRDLHFEKARFVCRSSAEFLPVQRLQSFRILDPISSMGIAIDPKPE